jgi:hypothetical protein
MALLPTQIDVDLTTVDTSYPVLAAGVYPFKVDTAIVKPNKANTGHLLELDCELLVDATDSKGKPIKAGYKMTHRCGLSPTDKYSLEDIAKNVATIQDAILGHRVALDAFDTDMLIGQRFIAKTKVTAETNEYPEKAEFGRLVAKDGSHGAQQ